MSRVIDDVYVMGSGADDSFRSGSASFGHPHVSGCWPFTSCRALYTEPVGQCRAGPNTEACEAFICKH